MSLKKEITIFIVLFIVSTLVVHNSVWFTSPIEHVNSLFSHPMPYHPLLYVLLIYIVLLVLRGIIALVKKVFSRK